MCLVFSTGNNRTSAKWLDIDLMFSEMGSFGILVKKRLSIRVFYFVFLQVGDVIWESKDDEYIWPRNWAILESTVYFKRSTLDFNINITELTHSKPILENTIEIEQQPVALDFKNLSQYSSHSK